MAVRPAPGCWVRIKGQFAFVATDAKEGSVQESFELQIDITKKFPKDLPTVTETGGRIPRNSSNHIYQDGSFCLGSPLGLMLRLSKAPTLNGFVETCIVPYLFAISLKLQRGKPLVYGELDHGANGILRDYLEILRLRTFQQVRDALTLLGMKKRMANKFPCPCGCRRRLGRCKFNYTIKKFRNVASRSWHKQQFLFLTIMEEREHRATV